MRYLKLYEEYDTIPTNFIRLNSIGHVLDPEEGIIYAMWKRGGYDHENGYEIDDDGEYADGLSDEDIDVVSNLMSSCEPFFRDRINFDLMQTAEEISLDYLDDGYTLVSQVLIESDEKDEESGDFIDYLVYSGIFSHQFSGENKYSRFFSKKMKVVKSKSDLIYRFWFINSRPKYVQIDGKWYDEGKKKIDEFNKEIFDRLKGMFPDENIVSK